MANFLRIEKNDLTNGPGIRVTIFFSGCDHHCKGCQNRASWDHNKGKEFTEEIENKVFSYLDHEYIDGLTLSGGDPFNIHNRSTVLKLLRDVKERFPNKNIWVWTGYLFEDLQKDELCKQILNYVDVLVDGKFEEEIRRNDLTKKTWQKDLAYRGSSNQRVIDVQSSINSKEIIIYETK